MGELFDVEKYESDVLKICWDVSIEIFIYCQMRQA